MSIFPFAIFVCLLGFAILVSHSKKIKYYVLWIIHLDGPCYGADLCSRLRQYTKGRVVLSPSALYPILQELLEDGLIEPSPGEEIGPHNRPRVLFQLKALGRRYIQGSKNPFTEEEN